MRVPFLRELTSPVEPDLCACRLGGLVRKASHGKQDRANGCRGRTEPRGRSPRPFRSQDEPSPSNSEAVIFSAVRTALHAQGELEARVGPCAQASAMGVSSLSAG